jgi:hypothetical protein
MIIYKTTDRIPLTIGSLKIWVSPLSLDQKTRLRTFVTQTSGEEKTDGFKFALELLRQSVKEIEGVQSADGSPYELDFGSDGCLTEECAKELIQLSECPSLIAACGLLYKEIKQHELEGVQFDLKGAKSVKKKQSQ